MEEVKAKAPVGCNEAKWAANELATLSGALDTYMAHRKENDPQRSPSHQSLYRTFNDVVRRVFSGLCHKNRGVAVKLPCVEADLEALCRKLMDSNMWLFACRGCGGETRGTKADFWTSSTGLCYCKSCVDQYTHKCFHCDTRTPREESRQSQLIRDTKTGKQHCICPECVKKPSIKSEVCVDCECRYINGPAGNADVTAEEIIDLRGRGVCFHCAGTYQRGECNHVASRLYEVVSVPNVEDDDRDREDIGRGFSRVCAKCRDKYSTDDDAVQHWNAQKKSCTSRTYEEVGSKRSFGVEIEVVQPQKMRPMPDDMKAYWTSKRDASLPEIGVELASTVLYGDSGLKVVKDLCDYAKRYDWRVDARAGLHLHIGLPDDGNLRMAAVAMGYHLTYDLWSSFVAPSRQRCKYCRKNSYAAEKLSTVSATDLIHMILTDPAIEGRRCWVNWHSYSLHNTVEIRLHHGTLMYDKIANWVKAHTRFVDWCSKQGTHEKVYEILGKLTVREQFLLITQDAWKDRALGRWFRGRAKELFDGCAPLPESNRKLRKRGVKPQDYKPGFNFQIGDMPAYVIKMSDRAYCVCNHPTGGRKSQCISMDGWSTEGPAVQFPTRLAGLNFIKLAAADGIGKALSTIKTGGARKKTIRDVLPDAVQLRPFVLPGRRTGVRIV